MVDGCRWADELRRCCALGRRSGVNLERAGSSKQNCRWSPDRSTKQAMLLPVADGPASAKRVCLLINAAYSR